MSVLPYTPMMMGSAGVTYDTNAQTYMNAVVTAGGSLTTGQKNGINRWFQDMKGVANGSYSTYNVFAQIELAYLYTQGASAAQDCINAVNPGTYNGTDTGSPTYNSTNKTVAFNGSSQYTDTTHTPNGQSTTFSLSDLTMMAFHRVDTNNDSNATIGEVGGGNSYGEISATAITLVMSASTGYGTLRTSTINHLWGISWSSSSTLNVYDNGSNFKANSTSWGNTATRSMYLGAYHGGSGPGYGGTPTIDFYIEGSGAWSDAEQLMIYNAGKALKVALGGTAWL